MEPDGTDNTNRKTGGDFAPLFSTIRMLQADEWQK